MHVVRDVAGNTSACVCPDIMVMAMINASVNTFCPNILLSQFVSINPLVPKLCSCAFNSIFALLKIFKGLLLVVFGSHIIFVSIVKQ